MVIPSGDSRFPGLLDRVLRELSSDVLFDAADEAARLGLSLADYVDVRCEAIRAQLVRDAAPAALRELRRCAS